MTAITSGTTKNLYGISMAQMDRTGALAIFLAFYLLSTDFMIMMLLHHPQIRPAVQSPQLAKVEL
jgi:hypothetical protein